jgi:HK97 family phage major capsid protein
VSEKATLVDAMLKRFDDIDRFNARVEKALFGGDGTVKSGTNRLFTETGDMRVNVLNKGFAQAKGRHTAFATFGGDGAAAYEVNLDGYYAGGRNKGLGCTDMWRAVAAAGCPGREDWTGWNVQSEGRPSEVLQKSGWHNPNKAWGKQKAPLAEGSGFTGGYTVPVQFYADLLRLMAEKAFVRERCTVLPMQSRSLLIPALQQNSTTFSRGQSQFFGGIVMTWTPESVTMNESEPIFREIELVANDLMFYTISSNQLLQDNAVALDTLLTSIFQEAVAWSYDYYILQGNAGNEPNGVMRAPGTYNQNRVAANTITQTDILNMLSRLYAPSWDNACWIINPSCLPQIVGLTNGATNSPFLTFLNPTPNSGDGGPIAQKFPATLAGMPVYWSEKAGYLGTLADIGVYDLSKVVVGDRLSIQIEASPHPGFTRNQMYWRVVTRWTAQPWVNSPITLADQTMTVSPYVVLGTGVI